MRISYGKILSRCLVRFTGCGHDRFARLTFVTDPDVDVGTLSMAPCGEDRCLQEGAGRHWKRLDEIGSTWLLPKSTGRRPQPKPSPYVVLRELPLGCEQRPTILRSLGITPNSKRKPFVGHPPPGTPDNATGIARPGKPGKSSGRHQLRQPCDSILTGTCEATEVTSDLEDLCAW